MITGLLPCQTHYLTPEMAETIALAEGQLRLTHYKGEVDFCEKLEKRGYSYDNALYYAAKQRIDSVNSYLEGIEAARRSRLILVDNVSPDVAVQEARLWREEVRKEEEKHWADIRDKYESVVSQSNSGWKNAASYGFFAAIVVAFLFGRWRGRKRNVPG
jgi:hypothetical protein